MTKRYAVIGDPVAHSLSPLMHTGWIADHGLDATYEAYRLRSDDVVAAIRGLTQFAGMNVTVPHKEAAAAAANRSESDAANVLRREADGSLSAFNTDGAGFLNALDEAAPGWRSRVKHALVLGAGGAAQGIAQSLSPYVTAVGVANRTQARAVELARALPNGHVRDWTHLSEAFAEADLIVQTTTLGMAGTDSPAWPFDVCDAGTIAVDIVYRPPETPFLAASRRRGLKSVDGLGMLIRQGALSFEIWHGIKPDVAKARARLEAALA
ncbi:MAG TPA: shikimate dehydrogenase [Candidatus Binatia bacterium]|nr:shikimate dehydrogenase [Candidatus Binatia bacterium]